MWSSAPTKEKYKAVADEIAELHEKKQPVLVGTTSIEKSELLSGILQRKGVRHVVLNAKQHEREAEYVAQAGRLGMVTIATNMAGRGTDILLGGNADFMTRKQLVEQKRARAISARRRRHQSLGAEGFLRFYYQGQEFEVSKPTGQECQQVHAEIAKSRTRRGDRSGRPVHPRHRASRVAAHRQPAPRPRRPPGRSRRVALLSLARRRPDAHLRQAVGHRCCCEKLGMEEGVPIESRMISKRIEGAQKAVEAQNFESRKHLLEYDDVMNKQREAVYGLRRQLLEGVEQRELILEDYVGGILSGLLDEFAGEKVRPDQWNLKGLDEKLVDQFGLNLAAAGIEAAGADAARTGRRDLRKADRALTRPRRRFSAPRPCAITSAW